MLITVNKAENVVERIGGPPPFRYVRKFFVVLANFAATAAAWLSGCFGKFLEVILCHKNGLKRALAKNYQLWGPKPREGKQMSFLWAASTANVTNASFKSSTVPLQTTLLACAPSERKSKDTAAVLVSCSRNYGPPCIYVYLLYICLTSAAVAAQKCRLQNEFFPQWDYDSSLHGSWENYNRNGEQ